MTGLSLQAIQKLREGENFVGRRNELAFFTENLNTSAMDPRHRFIFEITGQAGTGKTRLLEQFHEIAKAEGGHVAWTDEAEAGPVDALRKIVRDLSEPKLFREFLKLDEKYQELRAKLESDPEAPDGLSAALGQAAGRGVLMVGRQVPGLGLALELVGEEAAVSRSQEVAAFVARNLRSPEDLTLVRSPIEPLSSAFTRGLRGMAQDSAPIVLFFDTFEATRPSLEGWLWDLCQGRFDECPSELVLCIGGQIGLDQDRWLPYRALAASTELEVFSEEEARSFLRAEGITDDHVIATILSLTDGLPVLVAMLAAESPSDPNAVGDPSGTAIERFLRWIRDQGRRETVLAAAVPRRLNQDVLKAVLGRDEGHRALRWLEQLPFVRQRLDGWEYHPVVRRQLLRYQRKSSPDRFRELNRTLAEFYGELMSDPQSGEQAAMEYIYHCICGDVDGSTELALSGFVSAAEYDQEAATNWAEAVRAAEAASGVEDGYGESLMAVVRDLSIGETDFPFQFYEELTASDAPITDDARPNVFRRLAWLHRHQADYKTSEHLLTEALETQPRDPGLLSDRAFSRFRNGDYERALEDVSLALQEEAITDRARANLISLHARIEHAKDGVDAAVPIYRRAVQLDPNAAWATLGLGKALRELKACDEAVKWFCRALESDPGRAHELHKEIGLTLLSQGKPDEAAEAFIDALRDQVACLHCWRALATAYVVGGRDNISSLLEEAQIEGADDKRALVFRALALMEIGEYQAALDTLDTINDPTDPSLSGHRGVILNCMGAYNEARRAFALPLADDPEDVFCVYHGAVAALLAGDEIDIDGVRSQLTEALDGDDKIIAMYGLAGMSALTGTSQDAVRILREAAAFNPIAIQWARHDPAWNALRSNGDFSDVVGPFERSASIS